MMILRMLLGDFNDIIERIFLMSGEYFIGGQRTNINLCLLELSAVADKCI